MSKITYSMPDARIIVKLDGRIVGAIHTVAGGFQYQPQGTKRKREAEGGATVYPSLYACKVSLGDEQPWIGSDGTRAPNA